MAFVATFLEEWLDGFGKDSGVGGVLLLFLESSSAFSAISTASPSPPLSVIPLNSSQALEPSHNTATTSRQISQRTYSSANRSPERNCSSCRAVEPFCYRWSAQETLPNNCRALVHPSPHLPVQAPRLRLKAGAALPLGGEALPRCRLGRWAAGFPLEEGGGGAAEIGQQQRAAVGAEDDGGGPLVRVGWLAGTTTLPWQAGQAKDWPAAVSSTVNSVPHVGHGNFKSIRPGGQD